MSVKSKFNTSKWILIFVCYFNYLNNNLVFIYENKFKLFKCIYIAVYLTWMLNYLCISKKITKMQKLHITDSTIFVLYASLHLFELETKNNENIRINVKVVMILTIFNSVHKTWYIIYFNVVLPCKIFPLILYKN